MAVEAAFVDTNVLIDATNVARPRHRSALAVLEHHPTLVMSAQIAREYLVACTRPATANGLGLRTEGALNNLAQMRAAVALLPEEKPVLPTLLELLRARPCEGKVVHDASVVASLQVHGVEELITSNPEDFERFSGWVRLSTLEESLAALGIPR